MIIELFGLSGSGKSTIARHLDSTGKASRIRINSTSELLWRSIWYIVKHPKSSAIQLHYLLRFAGSPSLFFTKYMNLFLHHAAKRQKAEASKGYVVLDQGHLQNLLSLFETPQSLEELIKYLRCIPLPDQVWIFDVPEKERARRL